MLTKKKSVLLTKEDHAAILYYLRNHSVLHAADRESANALQQELKRARLLDENELPAGVVRLGSRLKVRDIETNALLELMIVTPDQANLKEKKISVLSPLGTALIGFCRGVTVKWKVPAGEKLFLIEEVNNK
ncbi:MAG: GreA/GreB family elongation factor [Chitinophagaceae bacterium]|jgi:regulator of nucleoside diphosphate kinase|nr:GreA/GreB family elongation factor [Chitinophagaceae bacterium]MBK7680244.1 GreA/GreB family elongation factor [Chitinophagaceae bacterium]MBK8301678.1 GreA/GreB family elongation factor [Chitinophagaceae bacterium]MBK9466236.1 GreA/GreB family elongation factor [Chitinophagaceae bacterium]MBK9661255.1 GreA/GreB family elongation factor [Chitinophagaceae bacterium]